MKKLLLILIASICLIGACSNLAFAANPYEDSDDPCTKAGYDDPVLCGYKNANEEDMAKGKVGSVINVVYGLIGIVAVVFVIIGGFKYMTSQGEPARVQQAKNTIMFSLIGLIVTLSAFAITSFILTALGSGGEGSGGGGSSDVIASLEITSGKTMTVGNTMQLKVKISPDYAKDKTLKFKSSDTNVATISDSGLIKAKSAGTTTITVTSNNNVSTSMTLTVNPKSGSGGSGGGEGGGSDAVSSIKLNASSLTLKVGQSRTIDATISPDSASNTPITWTSSNTAVATVDNKGTVKAIKVGTATITAKAGGKSATTTIKVEKSGTSYNAVWELRNYSHSNGKSYQYWINVPEGATDNMALVLFLHGDGQKNRPNDLANASYLKNMHADKGYIGIAPVCKSCGEGANDDWASTKSKTALKALVDNIVVDYQIDKSRIYIWGFSRGSIGTWEMVKTYGSFFKAAVPVSTCGRKTTFTDAEAVMFKNTKVYAVVGTGNSEDTSCMKTRVNKINSNGGSAQIKVMSGISHQTMTDNFPYTEIIDNWLLKQ